MMNSTEKSDKTVLMAGQATACSYRVERRQQSAILAGQKTVRFLKAIHRPCARFIPVFAVLMVLGSLGGCLSLLPGSDKQARVYSLSRPTVPDLASASSGNSFPVNNGAIVIVRLPSAPPYLSRQRIVLMRPGQKLSSIAQARWAAPIPRLVQDHILQSLGAEKTLTALRPGSGAEGDYVVSMDLFDFTAYGPEGTAPVIRFRLKLMLIERRSRKLLASRVFEEEVQADEERLASVMTAFDRTAQNMSQKITVWLSTALRRHARQT